MDYYTFWLFEETDSTYLSLENSANLNVDSMVFVFTKRKDGTFDIKEVYKPYKDYSTMIVNNIGQWSRRDGLTMSDVPMLVRRQNLRRFKIRVAIADVMLGFLVIAKYQSYLT